MTNETTTTTSSRGVGLAGRFAIAGGLLAIALGGAFAVIDDGLRQIKNDFETVSKVAQPMAEAAFEMEINAIGAGMGIVNYLHVPSVQHRQRFEDDRGDFQRFLQSYRQLAITDRQIELAARIGTRHDEYIRIGEFLLDAKDRSDKELTAVIASLREFDRALETEFEERPLADRRRQAVVAQTVETLERAIMGIPLLLADVEWGDDKSELGIAAAVRDIRSGLTTLARTAPERSAAVSKLSDGFEAIAPRAEASNRTQREMAVALQRFIALRNEMDDILDEEIQELTDATLGTANDDALKRVQNGRLALGGALAVLLAALISIFVYTARRVVRPIKLLVAYAADIERGHFTTSVDLTGVAEVGVLARAGANMVGALQSANEKITREAAERVKMQENLGHTQRMAAVGQLSGGIAHDFNNMLMVMSGYADRASRNRADPDAVEDALKEIRASVTKASGVVRRLSIFSGWRALEAQVFEIARLEGDIESLAKPTLGKQFTIECDFRAEGARVKCDASELTQAVLNLIINASHASSPGSTIKILVAPAEFTAESVPATRPPLNPGRYAIVSVADAGTGIPDAVVPHIFEPYFTTKPQGTGTGLGLASVYGFAAQSGGGISFTTKMGQGTTFYIYLPVTELAADVLAAQSSEVPRGQGETILLVDDDEQLLDLTREILLELGYNVHAANGAFEAIELANDALLSVDLMLSDVVMPVMTGVEAYDIIKDKRPGLPVIFMSGDTNRFGDVKLPENAKFLEKPVTTPVLAAALRSMLAGTGPKAPSPSEKELAAA